MGLFQSSKISLCRSTGSSFVLKATQLLAHRLRQLGGGSFENANLLAAQLLPVLKLSIRVISLAVREGG
jgi:hypothetical protein